MHRYKINKLLIHTILRQSHCQWKNLDFLEYSIGIYKFCIQTGKTAVLSRKLRAVSVFVSYPPFFNSIFRQANTSFSQNRQYHTPFYLFALYYHGTPWLLPDSILLPDSTIFSPIAILSAASKNKKIGGPPPTVMNPTKPKKPIWKPCFQLILSHCLLVPKILWHYFWIAACAAVILWWLLPLFTPFTPPNSTFDKQDSTENLCFFAESAIKWFQRNAPQRLTIPHKSAKIYLHKGTADRRLVRFHISKNSR